MYVATNSEVRVLKEAKHLQAAAISQRYETKQLDNCGGSASGEFVVK